MFHFVYKTISPSGKYYIGRRSTNKIDDGYLGSGKWVRSIKDKTILTREILEFASSFEDLKILEKQYIASHIDDPLNMNFNNESCGAASGDLNPMKNEDTKEKIRESTSGDKHYTKKPDWDSSNHWTKHNKEWRQQQSILFKTNNPTHNPETMRKIAEKTSRRMKEDPPARRPEVRKKIKETGYFATNNPSKIKVICPHCGKQGGGAIMKRWHFDNCKHKDN